MAYGDDLTGDYRASLKKFISAQTPRSSPVFRGSHDMWITWMVGVDDGEAGISYADPAAEPHRLRAIVGNREPSFGLNDHINTSLQEVAHEWLVPADLAIRSGGASIPVESLETVTGEVDAGLPFSGPLLLGRDQQHWGSYFQADASPMDGMHWTQGGVDDGIVRWDQQDASGMTVAPPNLPSVSGLSAYNDLDLGIMGLKDLALISAPAVLQRFCHHEEGTNEGGPCLSSERPGVADHTLR
jgi:hypothetical protein